ncbi:unnamed protein product [Auanema sp. JU1783]|nr:unnamed protein product [Auanema sp. JU1783]
MNGLFRKNPPKPKYATTWNTDTLREYLANRPKIALLEPEELERKTIILLALCSGRRVSELTNLNRDDILETESMISIPINYRNKNRSKGAPHMIHLAQAEEETLCPVKHINAYLNLTKETKCEKLFINRKTGSPLSSATLARWIKEQLSAAGISSNFSAHSIRGAVATKATFKGMSVDSLMKQLNWRSKRTVERFYLRPEALQESILL